MAVFVQSPVSSSWLQLEKQSKLCYDCIANQLKEWCCIDSPNFQPKFYHDSQEIVPGQYIQWPKSDIFVKTTISLSGGKGGFGSMLRAIGAQIEKTTNREACRDLSGRRLRDINEEKRLKDWVAKQADREREREEKKKKKMDKLKEEFHHEFHDPAYYKTRSEVADKVHAALEKGLEAASTSKTPCVKRKVAEPESIEGKRLKRMDAMWMGVSDSDSDSSEDGIAEPEPTNSSASTSIEEKQTTSADTETTTAVAAGEPETTDTNTEATIPSEETKKDVDVSDVKVSPADESPAEAAHTEIPSKETTVAEPQVFAPVSLEAVESQQELEMLGLAHLKQELQSRGLKCGGTLSDRASRLFSVKGLSNDQINPMLFAKPSKK